MKKMDEKTGKNKRGRKSSLSFKWKDEYYVRIYQLAKSGMSNNEIWLALGIHQKFWNRLKAERPAIEDALAKARNGDNSTGGNNTPSLAHYVYEHLPKDLQDLWDEINEAADSPSTSRRALAMLENKGRAAKQHLFLYGLLHYNFNATKVCRLLCTTKSEVDSWRRFDPKFAELMDEIQWHKGNFFEDALVKLVADGDGPATIFVNKTFNRSRGYAEKVDLKVTGKVEHDHVHTHLVDLNGLNLPLDVKVAIMKAIRKRDKQQEEDVLHLPDGNRVSLPSAEAEYEDNRSRN